MPEAIGTVGIVCPDQFPLLGFVIPVAAAIAMGNTVIAIPSEAHPLAATDLYQVLDTSDLPGGVVNIVTGAREAVVPTLAEHMDVDAIWYFGQPDAAGVIEAASTGNLKQVWIRDGDHTDWGGFDPAELLRHATQVKNIWVPYGA
jgi:aldehyde dehydrogenase (NAD+)